MAITAIIKDKTGTELSIGDQVELFDWGCSDGKSLGVVTLIWDQDEARLSCDPCIVESAYDFGTKALPRCVKLANDDTTQVSNQKYSLELVKNIRTETKQALEQVEEKFNVDLGINDILTNIVMDMVLNRK